MISDPEVRAQALVTIAAAHGRAGHLSQVQNVARQVHDLIRSAPRGQLASEQAQLATAFVTLDRSATCNELKSAFQAAQAESSEKFLEAFVAGAAALASLVGTGGLLDVVHAIESEGIDGAAPV